MAFGRDGTLYFADSGNNCIRAIAPDGVISTVAGNGKAGWVKSGTPALKAATFDPEAVTFGPDHRLYIAGFAVKTLVMITPKGIMKLPAGIGTLYPQGAGGLVTTPDGSVIAMNAQEIVRLTPHGMEPIFDFTSRSFDGITGFQPDGIAVGRNGEIYTDTWVGNGYTNRTALAEIRPDGKVRVLWKGK